MIKISSFLIAWLVLWNISQAQVSSTWKEAVVVDGQLDEWNEKLFKYDKSTWLWYAMSNDENFLYLAVRKNKNPGKIRSWGGLMVTVNRHGKEQRANAPWVTFPRAVDGLRKVPENEWTIMEVGNFEQIKTSKLNIYNEHGIQVGWTKAKAPGDLEETYCYELAIPLNLLNLRDRQELNFNVLLRGFRETSLNESNVSVPLVTLDHVKHLTNLSREEMQLMVQNANDARDWTEFWDKYQLATKPPASDENSY